jgi:hypothetical protein
VSVDVTAVWDALPASEPLLVRDPYELVAPYSKYQEVACPFGVTLPFSVAPLRVIAVAAPVVASGAVAPAVGVADASLEAGLTLPELSSALTT